jgi:hypothetical protein
VKSRKQGHFCKGCGVFLSNEKFSGRGHREHLCKECKKAGIVRNTKSNSNYDRDFHRLSNIDSILVRAEIRPEIQFGDVISTKWVLF